MRTEDGIKRRREQERQRDKSEHRMQRKRERTKTPKYKEKARALYEKKRDTPEYHARYTSDHYLALRRVRTYGISYDQAINLGKVATCQICGERPQRALYLDHDHETGKVRGMLCRRCNLLIGQIDDSPALFRSVLVYLKGHQQLDLKGVK